MKSVHAPTTYPGLALSRFRLRPLGLILSFVLRPLSFILFLSACAAPSQVPATPTVIVTPSPVSATTVTPSLTASPAAGFDIVTATPQPFPTLPEYLNVAVPTINPNDPLRFIFPTPAVFPTPQDWRPPLAAVPIAANPHDHFWFNRPIASDSVNYPLGSYRYGSTYFGQMNIHAGIDIDAPLHTPVLAAGAGQVVWADWGLFNFQPGYTEDPYGIAVVIKHDFGYNQEPLYTLYAHLEEHNRLFVGQRVQAGEVLGWIGVTGNTTGAHLHFEVRQGSNTYFHTRNPELWIAPYSGWGILAGQVLDQRGRPIPGTPIDIFNAQNRWVETVYTYGYRVANPDDQWREHFAISDLPAGNYHLRATLTITDTPQLIEGDFTMAAGQTNFILLQSGVGLVPNALPAQTATPPYPTNTSTYTPTPTSTYTPSPTLTITPSRTLAPTRTRRPTWTFTPSRTPRPTATPTPSRTPRVSPAP